METPVRIGDGRISRRRRRRSGSAQAASNSCPSLCCRSSPTTATTAGRAALTTPATVAAAATSWLRGKPVRRPPAPSRGYSRDSPRRRTSLNLNPFLSCCLAERSRSPSPSKSLPLGSESGSSSSYVSFSFISSEQTRFLRASERATRAGVSLASQVKATGLLRAG